MLEYSKEMWLSLDESMIYKDDGAYYLRFLKIETIFIWYLLLKIEII